MLLVASHRQMQQTQRSDIARLVADQMLQVRSCFKKAGEVYRCGPVDLTHDSGPYRESAGQFTAVPHKTCFAPAIVSVSDVGAGTAPALRPIP
jgi:hypothetical protein